MSDKYIAKEKLDRCMTAKGSRKIMAKLNEKQFIYRLYNNNHYLLGAVVIENG